MGQKILRVVQKRILKTLLDLAILARLRRRNGISGSDVIADFQKKFCIKLSPGTVYSTLYSMERKGIIKVASNSGRRVYILTENGEKIIEDAQNVVEEIESFVTNLISR